MHCLNIEMKARCNDQQRIREILRSQQADFRGVDHQIDTYFVVPHGRLKLREGTIENHLIFYERENSAGPKKAEIMLYDTKPESSLKTILLAALETLVVVDKQREIYFINNVKFHIDNVKELGYFIEIEAIDDTEEMSEEKLREQCEMYMKLFEIQDDQLITHSYSDLLLNK
ncbi:MAG: class IV adenylate cyclase [Candidatus Kerfeldbacteria bacterium]|nr:class IV adenylate cyclase [Candidatus Kerfeldbacteria bacterium]